MNKYFILIILMELSVTPMASLSNKISEPTEILFHSTSLFEEIITKLFSLLRLDLKSTNTFENRLLLSMFESLQNISIENDEMYSNIKNSTRLDLKFHKFENSSLFKLEKPLHEIIAEDINLNNNSKDNATNKEVRDVSMDIIIKRFMTDVKESLRDIKNPSKKIRLLYEKHVGSPYSYAIERKSNVWEPSNSTELLRNRRILNSKQVQIKNFPFIVSVHVKSEFVCTGAIVSRNMIITSASCLHETYFNTSYLQKDPYSVTVRVGSEYPDKFGELIEVTNFFIFPDFNFETLGNNVAILEIKKNLQLRGKNKKIRRINYHSGKIKKSPEVMLLGWGSRMTPTLKFMYQLDQLSRSMLNLMNNTEDCIKIYTSKFVNIMKNFCAGLTQNTGACQHDIGGPAIMGNKLVGLVSFAPPVCGTFETPTVFTNITFYIKWIDSIVNKNMPSGIQMRAHALIEKDPNVGLTRSPKLNKAIFKELRKAHQQSWYYDEDDFNTEPNSHLWVTTTIDIHEHPLFNQSVFLIDYVDPMDTKPTTPTTTASHKPLDEVLLDYYFETGEKKNPPQIQKSNLLRHPKPNIRNHVLVMNQENDYSLVKTPTHWNPSLLWKLHPKWSTPRPTSTDLEMQPSVTPNYEQLKIMLMDKRATTKSIVDRTLINPNNFYIENFLKYNILTSVMKNHILKTPATKHFSSKRKKLTRHTTTSTTESIPRATMLRSIDDADGIHLRASNNDFKSIDFPNDLQSFKSDEYILILRKQPTTTQKSYTSKLIPNRPRLNVLLNKNPTRFEIVDQQIKNILGGSAKDNVGKLFHNIFSDTSHTSTKPTTESSNEQQKIFNDFFADLTPTYRNTNEKSFNSKKQCENETVSGKERELQKILVLLMEREIVRGDKSLPSETSFKNKAKSTINVNKESDKESLEKTDERILRNSATTTDLPKQELAITPTENYGNNTKLEKTNSFENSEGSRTDISEEHSDINNMSTTVKYLLTKDNHTEIVEIFDGESSEDSNPEDDDINTEVEEEEENEIMIEDDNNTISINNTISFLNTLNNDTNKTSEENQQLQKTNVSVKSDILDRLTDIVNSNDSDTEYINPPRMLRVSENMTLPSSNNSDNGQIIKYNNTLEAENLPFLNGVGDSYEIIDDEDDIDDNNRRSGLSLNDNEFPSFLNYIDF